MEEQELDNLKLKISREALRDKECEGCSFISECENHKNAYGIKLCLEMMNDLDDMSVLF